MLYASCNGSAGTLSPSLQQAYLQVLFSLSYQSIITHFEKESIYKFCFGHFRLLNLFFYFLFASSLQAQPNNQAISLPTPSVSKDLSEAVNDMVYWLTKATGKTFEIIARNAKGIQLQLVAQSNLSEAIKKKILSDGQTFYLNIDSDKTVRIVGSGDQSLINGIYTYLHELGFRWYMPGDAWTIVPKLNKINLKISKVYTPDFQNRSYFGTGGVNPVPELDPQNTFLKDFSIWNRRNRLSSDYVMKGHMGQAFYSANQKVLNEHTEYFCNGKSNTSGRIDIGNPGAVNLYVQWALQQVNPKNRFNVIGVDPADGSGGGDDCLPANMPQIKTWSDKYFWLANKVAQASEKEGNKALVNLYAYSSHSAPPGFALHPQVYPVIIPYAFQRVTTPQDFIRLWSKKLNGRAMGLYDYWNITQWSVDVPQFNIYSIKERLRFWKKYNVTTINLESTNAKGPMGHAFWLATQMMWNTRLSFDSLYNQFLLQCFGPAAADIKNMYDRWSQNYQERMEVNLSIKDLATATTKTKDKAILTRLTELKAYIHYLRLYYDYLDNRNVENYERLIGYIHLVHPLRLVQTSALQAYYIPRPAGYTVVDRAKSKAEISTPSLPELYQQVETEFQKDQKENKFSYTLSSFVFDMKRAKAPDTSEKAANPLYLNGPNQYQFYWPIEKTFEIRVGSSADTRLKILDSLQNIKLDQVIQGSKEGYSTVSVKLKAGKYSFYFGAFARFSRVLFPKDIVFVSVGMPWYDNAGFPLQYIYVPKDVGEIVYQDMHGPGTNGRGFWLTPDGRRVDPEKVSKVIYRVQVVPEYRGKVWTLNIGHPSFKLLNIPHVLSLRKFNYKED